MDKDINKLCLTCRKRCKQSTLVVMVKCVSYDPVDGVVIKPLKAKPKRKKKADKEV